MTERVGDEEKTKMKRMPRIFVPSIILFFVIFSSSNLDIIGKFNSGTPDYGKGESVMPMDLRGHKIYIKTRINDELNEYDFILDTGSLTALDVQTVNELNLQIGSKLPQIGDVYLIDTELIISLGDIKVKDFIVPMIDLPEASGSDPRICGFIGSDFLRFFRLTIDYRQERIVLGRSIDTLDIDRMAYDLKIETPFPLRFPLVECLIDEDIEVKGMIDTGSPFAFVFPLSMIERQVLTDKKQLIKSKGVMAKWPFTTSDENYLSRVSSITMGELEIENIPVIYAELPNNISHVLIGKEFLSQFEVTIDYPAEEMALVPYKDAEFKNNLFSTGLGFTRDEDGKIIVQGYWEDSPADRSDIEINDEVLEINASKVKDVSMREIKNILEDDEIKTIELLIANSKGTKRLIIEKEMLFPEIK